MMTKTSHYSNFRLIVILFVKNIYGNNTFTIMKPPTYFSILYIVYDQILEYSIYYSKLSKCNTVVMQMFFKWTVHPKIDQICINL